MTAGTADAMAMGASGRGKNRSATVTLRA
jgi:hypothetical protein